jgi:hypothetical protein
VVLFWDLYFNELVFGGFFSGGRLEGSKCNLNFQSATWHHFQHLQSKDFFSHFIIICKLDSNCYHVHAMAVVIAKDLVLGLNFSCCHKLHKPLQNGCVMTYMYPTYTPFSTPATTTSSSSKEKYGLCLYHEGWKKIDY